MNPEDADQVALTLVRAVVRQDADARDQTVINAGVDGILVDLFEATLGLAADALQNLADERGVDIEELLDGIAVQDLEDREAR
ncbi:hypothetical protein [Nocardiopsis nanhaiensis]